MHPARRKLPDPDDFNETADKPGYHSNAHDKGTPACTMPGNAGFHIPLWPPIAFPRDLVQK